MGRITLKENQIIHLMGKTSKKKITMIISKVISEEGSSCLVYKAYMAGNESSTFILKEFFPKIAEKAKRLRDGTIDWASDATLLEAEKAVEFKNSINRFVESVKVMQMIKTDETYKKYLPTYTDLEVLEANGTYYYLNDDYGRSKTWDMVREESFLRILTCSIGVATFLAYLHQHQMAYVDLKPENILLLENGVGEIDYNNPKFFDFNSILTFDKYPRNSIHGTAKYLPEKFIGRSKKLVQVDNVLDICTFGKILDEKTKHISKEDVPEEIFERFSLLLEEMLDPDSGITMKTVAHKLNSLKNKLREQGDNKEKEYLERNKRNYNIRYKISVPFTIIAYIIMTGIWIGLGVKSQWVLSHSFAKSKAFVLLMTFIFLILNIITLIMKYRSSMMAREYSFSEYANDAVRGSSYMKTENFYDDGYRFTIVRKIDRPGFTVFYRPVLWGLLFIVILVSAIIVLLKFTSVPLAIAIAFAAIIIFMYVEYVPKDNNLYYHASTQIFEKELYQDIRYRGNEKALFFLREYRECQEESRYDLSDPFYVNNHLDINSNDKTELVEHAKQMSTTAIRLVYMMAWDCQANIKRIVDLVLMAIGLIVVFLDLSLISGFFVKYFHIPDIIYLPLTLLAIVVNGIVNCVELFNELNYSREMIRYLFVARYYKEDALRECFEQDIQEGKMKPIYIARGIQDYNEDVYIDGNELSPHGNMKISNWFLLHHLAEEEKRRVTIDIWLGFGILFSVFIWHMGMIVLLPGLLLGCGALNYLMLKKGVYYFLQKNMIRKVQSLKRKYPSLKKIWK